TGKELVARAIHKRSKRADDPFIAVNCSAIPKDLLESELFGHEKGAFTGAHQMKKGRVELAHRGTLFLDEIGNLSVSLQAKLLKAIQDREIIRVGASIPIPVDIRLICATNTNLEELVLNNLFREDLLYRINTIQIHLPPLRERKDDIPLLLEYFLKKYQKKYHKPPFKVSEKAYGKLNNHLWPGNIREFKHTIEKVVILSESNTIKSDDFFFGSAIKPKYEQYDTMNLADVEKNIIEKALKASNGNLSNAAKILNISRTTLYSKIKKYGL
ncbi:MAG: sigma-54-dependent Fis family transcriptional regulator, partial [Bacteroidales bacterium]|nr:sigma-54-dependent Fis family transcriptional regulator [Bacteroidales bacterium]